MRVFYACLHELRMPLIAPARLGTPGLTGCIRDNSWLIQKEALVADSGYSCSFTHFLVYWPVYKRQWRLDIVKAMDTTGPWVTGSVWREVGRGLKHKGGQQSTCKHISCSYVNVQTLKQFCVNVLLWAWWTDREDKGCQVGSVYTDHCWSKAFCRSLSCCSAASWRLLSSSLSSSLFFCHLSSSSSLLFLSSSSCLSFLFLSSWRSCNFRSSSSLFLLSSACLSRSSSSFLFLSSSSLFLSSSTCLWRSRSSFLFLSSSAHRVGVGWLICEKAESELTLWLFTFRLPGCQKQWTEFRHMTN